MIGNEPKHVPEGLSLAETIRLLRIEHNRLVDYCKRIKPIAGLNTETTETSDGTMITGRPGKGGGNSNEPRWL